jgi:hypothetical protein
MNNEMESGAFKVKFLGQYSGQDENTWVFDINKYFQWLKFISAITQ